MPTAPNGGAVRVKSTSLQPKFLKDLGFEKPSWLPDFGGAKKEEKAAEAAVEAAGAAVEAAGAAAAAALTEEITGAEQETAEGKED